MLGGRMVWRNFFFFLVSCLQEQEYTTAFLCTRLQGPAFAISTWCLSMVLRSCSPELPNPCAVARPLISLQGLTRGPGYWSPSAGSLLQWPQFPDTHYRFLKGHHGREAGKQCPPTGCFHGLWQHIWTNERGEGRWQLGNSIPGGHVILFTNWDQNKKKKHAYTQISSETLWSTAGGRGGPFRTAVLVCPVSVTMGERQETPPDARRSSVTIVGDSLPATERWGWKLFQKVFY